MGWQLQTRPDVLLKSGTTIQFILHYSYVPLIGGSAENIQAALSAETPLFIATVNQRVLLGLFITDEWEIVASTTENITIGELSSRISNTLNKWYSWGVSVIDLKTETWLPSLPSTQTAVSLSALAIIGIIGLILARRGGLL